MKRFQLTVGANTDRGNVKKVNQDALLHKVKTIGKSEVGLFVVCDGLGGLQYGEIASAKVVSYFEKWWDTNLGLIIKNKHDDNLIRESLQEVLIKSNEKLVQLANEVDSKLGTTASVLFIINDVYYIVHIGDSRIYEVNSSIKQLTEDHSQYEMLKRQGVTDLQNIKKNVLTQCIGVKNNLDIFYKKGRIRGNTNFLLCSDGLHNKMDINSVINKFSSKSKKKVNSKILQEICEELIEEVKNKKETDNITAMGINVKQKTSKKKDIELLLVLGAVCLGLLIPIGQNNKIIKQNETIKEQNETIKRELEKLIPKDNKNDDTSINNKSNGTSINNKGGGTSINNKGDGTSINNKGDDTSINNKSDDTSIDTKSDGTSIDTKSDGTSIDTKSDGTSINNKSDGTLIDNKSDDTYVDIKNN